MRRFDAEYLEHTREGMWADSRAALADLALDSRERVLDVGCGTGALTRVLRAESPATVIGLDADPRLLDAVTPPVVLGDATRLPVRTDGVDLVVCQALLVNLPSPVDALGEFARASSDLVAVVEPDNARVAVESTVDAEPALAQRARECYLAGLDTDATLGSAAPDLFRAAGLEVVSTSRYDQQRVVAPPYDADDVEAARRKVTGEGLADDAAAIRRGFDARGEDDGGDTSGDRSTGESGDDRSAGESESNAPADESDEEASDARPDDGPQSYDALLSAWRSMGRTVVDQMTADAYERTETVPFYVTVGRV